MADPVTPLLRVTGLARYFDVSAPLLDRLIERRGREVLKAVDGVDFVIGRGETFALVGESGCGKSTTARLVMGLHRPTRGRIVFDGIDLATAPSRALHRRRQMIFQDPYASLNPRRRVRDIVAEPLRAHGLARRGAALRDRVDALLGQVRLAPADGAKFPHEFSGGQRQRISIARAIASLPDFIVCDEPTSALDVSVQAQILNLMTDLQRDLGLTYLFISHNLAVVYQIATTVGVMYLGRLVEVAPTVELFGQPRHPYTQLLLATAPDASLSRPARMPMAGEAPDPIHPPSGCAFHPRCPVARERCRRVRPEPLAAGAGGGRVACHGVAEGWLPL